MDLETGKTTPVMTRYGLAFAHQLRDARSRCVNYVNPLALAQTAVSHHSFLVARCVLTGGEPQHPGRR